MATRPASDSGPRATNLLMGEFMALLPFGVILSAPDGTVVHANPLARHLLERRQALWIGADGRLAAGTAGATRRLREAIRSVAGGAARIPWPASVGSHPLPVVARALASPHATHVRLAALFVGDPRALPREKTLRELHGFTPAEARLTIELLQGHRVSEAARRLEISPNTVKSQLRRIFEKTGVRRQCEVVRLMMDPVACL